MCWIRLDVSSQVPMPVLKRAVQLAAWRNFSGALALIEPYVRGNRIKAISDIFQQCAEDPSNAPKMLRQLISAAQLSEFELLPNQILQRIFAQTLVYNRDAPLGEVSEIFDENVSDQYVIYP